MQSPIRDSKNSPPPPSRPFAPRSSSVRRRSPPQTEGHGEKLLFLLLLLLLQTPRTHVRCHCRNCSSSRNGGRGGGGSEDVDLQPSAHRRRHPSAGVRLHSPHAAACSSAGARFSTYTRAKHRKVGPTPGVFFPPSSAHSPFSFLCFPPERLSAAREAVRWNEGRGVGRTDGRVA